MSFLRPVFVGDLVSCYATVKRVGRSSVTVEVETWVERRREGRHEKATEGLFTYVAVDDTGRPRACTPAPGLIQIRNRNLLYGIDGFLTNPA